MQIYRSKNILDKIYILISVFLSGILYLQYIIYYVNEENVTCVLFCEKLKWNDTNYINSAYEYITKTIS